MLAYLSEMAEFFRLGLGQRLMPDISAAQGLLDATVFLYKSVEDATSGTASGGSGVVVGVPLRSRPDLVVRYVVTNWHVARDSGASVIRLNTKSGGIHILEKDPSEWTCIAGGADIAVIPLDVPADVAVDVIPTTHFIDESDPGALFVGDDVFMVGRFIDFDGKETNKPALRFGAVSMLNAPVRQSTGYLGGSHVIDMHSRSGFSGSPVYVYRPGTTTQLPFIFNNPELPKLPGPKASHRTWGVGNNTQVRLLGLLWGQFREKWRIDAKVASSEAEQIQDGEYVSGLSGMCCAVPSSDVLKGLNVPALVAQREAIEISLSLNSFPQAE